MRETKLINRTATLIGCVLLGLSCEAPDGRAGYPSIDLVPYDPSSAVESRFEVTDSAGVEMIRNGSLGEWGAGLAELVEEVRIGVVFGSDEYQLYRVLDIVPHRDGSVVVRQGGNLLSVYGPDGEHVRRIGRGGEGPGEYGRIERMWFEGDSLVIVDVGNARMTMLSIEGEILGEHSIISPTHGQIRARAAGPMGWVAEPVAATAELSPEERRALLGVSVPEGQPYRRAPRRVHRWTPFEPTLGEPVFEIPSRIEYGFERGEFGLRTGFFSHAPAWTFGESGELYLGDDATYRITMFAPDGRASRIIERDFGPVPLGSVEVEAVISAYADHAYQDALDRGEAGWSARIRARDAARSRRKSADVPFPPYQPPIGGRSPGLDRGLAVSADGWLWVERTDAMSPALWELSRFDSDFWVTRSRWDVFSPEGRFQGTVEPPPKFELHAVEGASIWGVIRDALDIEYVVRLRVAGAGSGSGQ